MKQTKLSEIYKPLFENVVVEFDIPETTKSGLSLSKETMKSLKYEYNPCMKVVAIGDGVKSIKVGDWIITNPNSRPVQIPLIYKDSTKGVQHAQIHVSDILGIVDSDFAQIKVQTKLEIN